MAREAHLEKKREFRINRRRVEPNYSMGDSHFHPYYEILYLAFGSCDMVIGGRRYHMEAGDLVLVRSMVLHRTVYYGGSESERVVVNFSEDYLDMLKAQCNASPVDGAATHLCISIPRGRRDYVESLLSRMEFDECSEDVYYRLLCKMHLYELLIFIYHCEAEAWQPPSDPGEEAVWQAFAYIQANYGQDLTLKSVAERFNMNPTYFSRRFKQVTSYGFREYLVLARVRQASVLLLETEATVTEIADRCGFADSNYFSQVFKKIKGISPREYRKNPEAI